MRTARWLTKTDKDEVDGVNQEVSLSDAAMHSVAKWSIGDFKDEHVGGRAKSSPLTRYPMPCCLGQIRTMKIPERKIQNQQMSVIQNIKIWNVSIFWRALKSDWCQRNVSLYREIENSNTKLLYPQNSTFFPVDSIYVLTIHSLRWRYSLHSDWDVWNRDASVIRWIGGAACRPL